MRNSKGKYVKRDENEMLIYGTLGIFAAFWLFAYLRSQSNTTTIIPPNEPLNVPQTLSHWSNPS